MGKIINIAEGKANKDNSTTTNDNMTIQEAKAYMETVYAEIMKDWDCSYLEAVTSVEYDCETLERTRELIAEAVTYSRLMKQLLPGNIAYIKNLYKDEDVTDSLIQQEAIFLTEENAYMFSHKWTQLDDYETMSDTEIEAVLYGTPDENGEVIPWKSY